MLSREVLIALISGGTIGAVLCKALDLLFTSRANNTVKLTGAAATIIDQLQEEVERLAQRIGVLEKENQELKVRLAEIEKEREAWLKSERLL